MPTYYYISFHFRSPPAPSKATADMTDSLDGSTPLSNRCTPRQLEVASTTAADSLSVRWYEPTVKHMLSTNYFYGAVPIFCTSTIASTTVSLNFNNATLNCNYKKQFFKTKITSSFHLRSPPLSAQCCGSYAQILLG